MHRNALIIEDESGLARNMQMFFERAGYAARTACCAEAALLLIDASRPDIILLDYRLPGMDGLELLACLHARDPDVKVIMLTGAGSVEVAVQAMRLGAADFLTKPVALANLRRVVDRVLGPAPTEIAEPGHADTHDADARTRGAELLARFARDIRRLFRD